MFYCPTCHIETDLITEHRHSEAKHFDDGKLPLQYVMAMPFIKALAEVGAYGNKKYGNYYNYREGMPWMKLLGSITRHIHAFINGENNDKESGLSHLAHAGYDIAMLYEYIGHFDALDDRPRGL